ncbi:MAG: AAA family ATPase [Nitrospira sp.]|jgi:succinoglycan biosynthesis transport protein ExoP|nr:AAA family ATPase [Nitrospira sp.]
MGQTTSVAQNGNSAANLVHEYWGMVLRRKWILLGAIVLSLGAAFIYSKVATKVYRSDTLILLEDQKVPESYVQSNAEGNSNFDRRIFVIETQVRDRMRLDAIRKELNLYPAQVEEFGPEWAVLQMNAALEVTTVSKGNMPGQNMIGAFTVSFAHEDPATAMNVISKISAMLIDEDLKDRTKAAEGTTEFLDNEVSRTRVQLDRKEEEISQFKSQHVGQLPQQIEANLRALDRLHDDLNLVSESIHRQTDRLVLVENALQKYLEFGVTIPALVNGPVQPNPSFARLNDLKNKLTQLESEFWDGYPEVALTKEEINQLEQKLRRQYGPDSAGSNEQTKDPYYQDLKKQRSELGSELGLLKQRQQTLRAEKKNYDSRVETAPAIEQGLLTLMRDYENLKGSYQSLLDKRLHASVAENLEKRQKGAQLKILERPKFPRVPERPNQPRVLMLGLLMGCAMGVGLAVLLEQLNPQFRRPEDVESVFGPQLLAAIPDFSLDYAYSNWRRFFPTYHFGRGAKSIQPTPGLVPLPAGEIGNNGSNDHLLDRSFVVKWMPNAIVSEQYRVAATRLFLLGAEKQSTVVAVSSAVKGEGKTTTVINLGYTLARDLGKRVLLVDCDLKCPGLHNFMEGHPKGGMADYLAGDLEIDECVAGFGEVPCWIMPVGNPVVNSSELLRTDRLAALFDRLRNRFDYIILNTPPILPQATMNVLAGHSDILLLVVRANSTPHDVVKRAVSSLRSRKPLHVVLNAVGSQSLPSYVYEYAQPQVPTTRGRLKGSA